MSAKLCVSHIAGSINASALEDLFTTVGDVQSVSIASPEETGLRPRFAYVEMGSAQQAADCIERFHGRAVGGQILAVAVDAPRVPNIKAAVPLLLKKKKSRRAPIRLSPVGG